MPSPRVPGREGLRSSVVAQRPPGDTRARILEAGRALLQGRGYTGFSFADVAERVGVRKASLHHHFPSKEDLVVALIGEYRETFAAVASAFTPGDGAAEAALTQYFDYNRRIAREGELICSAGALSAAIATLPPAAAALAAEHVREIERWLVTVIRDGRRCGAFAKRGSDRATAVTVSAAVQGALQIARATQSPAAFDAVIRRLWQMLREP